MKSRISCQGYRQEVGILPLELEKGLGLTLK